MLRTTPRAHLLALILLSLTANGTAAESPPQNPPATVRTSANADLGEFAARQPFTRVRAAAGLRAPMRSALQSSRRERERAAMRAIAAGFDALRTAPPKSRADHAARHFARAARHEPPGHDALYALAATADDPAIAELALRAPHGAYRSTGSAERAAGLLLTLLDHPQEAIAMAAFEQLTWLLDGDPMAGDVVTELQRRARTVWDGTNEALALERWNPTRRRQPSARTVLPFHGPRDAVSRAVALAATLGDPELLQRLHDCRCQPRFELLCHALAAPRVDAEWAGKLFKWYRGQPAKWSTDATDLNAWQLGVVTILVGVLPQLPRETIAWYESQLTSGVVGSAARFAAHRRLCQLRTRGGHNWFEASQLPLDRLRTIDLLKLWAILGNPDDGDLPTAIAPISKALGQKLRVHFLSTILLELPLPAATAPDRCRAELAVLTALFEHPSDLVAVAAADRANRLGAEGRKALARWLADRTSGREPKPGLRARVRELACEHAVELPIAPPPHGAAPSQRSPAQRNPALGGPALRVWLHTAGSRTHWSREIARRIAQQTSSEDPLARRAAYLALQSPAAAAHAVSALASEAALDPAAIVRATTHSAPGRHARSQR
ncbi:MAG: hypothetical protein NXI31_00520 [bacterium]|nr:hypothetical protein [bacterium]